MKFIVEDADDNGKADFIADFEVDLGVILVSDQNTFHGELVTYNTRRGDIFVRWEPVIEDGESINTIISVTGLKS